jgi:hypothetical protein
VPVDRDGNPVAVGTLVRVLRLSGRWFDDLPDDEREAVSSMIGETLRVHEIDEYGQPWVMKEWPGEIPDSVRSHDIALDSDEMLVVETPD